MHADARRGVSAILASCERWLVWAALALYMLGVAAPWVVNSVAGRTGTLLFVAAFCAWLLVFSRPLATAWQMEAMRMPGALRTLHLALSAAASFGIIFPGAVFALGAGWPMLDGMALAAAAGMLGLAIAWMPGRIAWALGFAPALLMSAADEATRQAVFGALDALPLQVKCWSAAMVAGGVAWASASSCLAYARRDALPAWRRPMPIWWTQQRTQTLGARKGWVANVDMAQHYAAMPAWVLGINRAAAFGVARRGPVLALRTWLGSPFTPLHSRDRVRQLVIVFGSLLIYPLLMLGIFGQDANWTHFLSLGGGFALAFLAMLFVLVFPLALLQRRMRASAEFADLALLPGLGDARAHLLRAIGKPLLASAALLGVLAAMLVWLGNNPSGHVGIVLGLLAFVAMATAGSLRALAGLSIGPLWSAGVIVVQLLMMVTLSALQIPKLAPLLPAATATWFHAGAPLVIMIYGVVGWIAWRRYRDLPHPFLQD